MMEMIDQEEPNVLDTPGFKYEWAKPSLRGVEGGQLVYVDDV